MVLPSIIIVTICRPPQTWSQVCIPFPFPLFAFILSVSIYNLFRPFPQFVYLPVYPLLCVMLAESAYCVLRHS